MKEKSEFSVEEGASTPPPSGLTSGNPPPPQRLEVGGLPSAHADKSKKFLLLGGAVAVVGVIVLIVVTYMTDSYTASTFSMGSYVQQTLYGGKKEEAAQQAASAVSQLEELISWKVEDSDIQRLNANAGGEFVKVEPTTFQLLQLAWDVGEVSNGSFDITIAPISQLWDFESEKRKVPDAMLITSLLPQVGRSTLMLGTENTVALYSAGNAVELGSVGKGAACDVAVASYEAEGISGGIVAVGGSVGIYGNKPFGGSWKVAVRDPGGTGGMGILSIQYGFLSTSGDYEKGFEEDGIWYHHILDPQTGYPAEGDLRSVTVWTPTSGALSDALSTACFVMGMDDGLELLETYESEAVFITKDNRVLVTEGLKDKFQISVDSYSELT